MCRGGHNGPAPMTNRVKCFLTSDHSCKFVNEKVRTVSKKLKVIFQYSISENKCSIEEKFQKPLLSNRLGTVKLHKLFA